MRRIALWRVSGGMKIRFWILVDFLTPDFGMSLDSVCSEGTGFVGLVSRMRDAPIRTE